MNFDLRYPFSQILSKPGLSGTSHVGAGSEQGGKAICKCELHATNCKKIIIKLCSCSSSAKTLEIMVVKVVTDHSTLIKFTVSLANSSCRSFGNV